MTSSKSKSSYVVKFAQTEADQQLLQIVERALAEQNFKSFSDLCKQALWLMLTAEHVENASMLPMLAVLEQQLMTLQLQVMQLERPTEPQAEPQPNAALEQQVQQLTERVTQLEQKVEAATLAFASGEPEPEPDPLLSRLAPLLEDF